jgi:transcriptional regulator with GAF, ATPase, and Fis domain
VPVKERLLEHGDQIQIGDVVLIFLLEDKSELVSALPELDERELDTLSLVRLRREDSVYLRDEKLDEVRPASETTFKNLNTLLKVSRTVQSTREPDTLRMKLLEMIFEGMPAEQGTILLLGDDSETFTSAISRQRNPGSGQFAKPSRTIVQKVLNEGNAILITDILKDETFKGIKSVAESDVRSVLCVGLEGFQRRLGVVYLASWDPLNRFSEDHLHILSAIAAIASTALENALHLEWLKAQNQRLQAEVKLEHNIVGGSLPLRRVTEFVGRVAAQDVTVLICGESGTGKELVARAVHSNSPRNNKPFVTINCAAIPENLLESELFGSEKGAFTGAPERKGRLELAHGGTVFLDEIGEMALPLQAKLLRVLQDRRVERLGGGARPIQVDLRWVAATNKDLKQAIRDGKFREDLYFRINVVSLQMPALRERRDDIPLLALHFVNKYKLQYKRPVMGLSDQARDYLSRYSWPGNVRQLENAIQYAVVMGSSPLILAEDLPEYVLEGVTSPKGSITRFHEAVLDAKKEALRKALEQAGGNKTEAAKYLGIHPNNLHRLIRSLEPEVASRKTH